MLLLRFGQADLACYDRRVEFDEENGFVDATSNREIVGSDLQNEGLKGVDASWENGGYC